MPVYQAYRDGVVHNKLLRVCKKFVSNLITDQENCRWSSHFCYGITHEERYFSKLCKY